jgi:exopolyphosphatase/guanosine-5'-triphosphate,3'-diphosphate pyrophosphatase
MRHYLHHSSHRRNGKRLPIIAAIDLGTNSCRLLIARVQGQHFKVIDSFSRVIRLGEGIHISKQLNRNAIERAIKALRICRSKISHNRVSKVRAVTTEACRQALNSSELVNRVSQELNLTLEIISSQEEARLALSGCSGVLDSQTPYAIAFDIGGGSTELMWIKVSRTSSLENIPTSYEVIDYISIPYGVVTLSEQYDKLSDSLTHYAKIRHEICEKTLEFAERNNISPFLENNQVQMIGTSGTVTTLAALNMNLDRYERRVIDGTLLSIDLIHKMSEKICSLSYNDRAQHPCIGKGRADLIVAGAAILQGICDALPTDTLRVADRGVREGILVDLARQFNQEE